MYFFKARSGRCVDLSNEAKPLQKLKLSHNEHIQRARSLFIFLKTEKKSLETTLRQVKNGGKTVKWSAEKFGKRMK